MLNDTLYWIWLSCVLGQGSKKLAGIINFFSSPKEVYNASKQQLIKSGCFSPVQADQIKSLSLDEAKRIYEKCEQCGQKVLTLQSKEYPLLLKDIYNPPAVLYVKGKLPDMDNSVGITVVGSRECTDYGRRAAYLLGYRLAKGGAIIVSGGARGIDTAAHTGCLEAGGVTVAVLACGIDVKYLIENIELRDRISKSGALLSEYPPGMGVKPYHFHARNRIISAIARGTVVVEAGISSGSLITATHASEQGKDIFALPGNIQSPFSAGTNRLIKDGAFVVESPADILRHYAGEFPHLINMRGASTPLFDVEDKKVQRANTPSRDEHNNTYLPLNKDKINRAERKSSAAETTGSEISAPKDFGEKVSNKAIPEDVSAQAQKILSAFYNNTVTTDDIVERTALSTGEILRGITELELYGYIISLPGGRFKRT